MKRPGESFKEKRRCLILSATLAAIFFSTNSNTRAQRLVAPPPAEILQAGDLIWPKKPAAIVPYNSQPGEADEGDAQRWEREKKAYLEKVRRKLRPSRAESDWYSALQNMTYAEFIAEYLDDQSPAETATFGSSGGVAVGHVGIIQIVNGRRNVVEAMVTPGVRMISYAEWLHDRRGELVWVGRLKNVPADKRAEVAKIAASYIGRPYDFWNFNLQDATGFYCSKLAWLSILTGAGFPPDGKRKARRILWYSPKQLMYSSHVQLIVDPGSYGSAR